MNDATNLSLLITLFVLILLSGFFSSSETGMMSLNRYRLRHLAKGGHQGARRASKLLKRPDQLIGVILIGNNFVNILASAIATVLALRIWGDAGIAIATTLLTIVILIFAEVTPKTLAALYPEKVAFPASLILVPLLRTLYPLVWVVNLLSNGLIRMVGIKSDEVGGDHLSREELRTLVHESGARLPQQHQQMLLSVLDLEQVTVEDIMIPRAEILGIDLEDDQETIEEQIRTAQHTRLPVYKGDVNNILGILHLRNIGRLLFEEEINKAKILQICRDPYFIPEGTPLHTQLFNFQREKRRIGIVVDEYGDVVGLATLEDILEEIVGEFTTDMASSSPDITRTAEGETLVDGSISIRTLNKAMDWNLPTDGPKTLSGLITEALESIPDRSVCLQLHGHRLEIKQVKDHVVKTVLIRDDS